MSISRQFSIVEYYGEQKDYKCGYCKASKCHSHGLWAHSLSVNDYQNLIDRGWRRSGYYCYKPSMENTCCPSYTIKLNSPEFKVAKSHKKIVKKVNRFLSDGIRGGEDDSTKGSIGQSRGESEMVPERRNKLNVDQVNCPITKSDKKPKSSGCKIGKKEDYCKKIKKEVNLRNNELASGSAQCSSDLVPEKLCKAGDGVDLTKPKCKKAKQLRLERKRDKLALQGIDFEIPKKNSKNNCQKSIEDLLNDFNPDGVHKLKVILVSSEKGATTESFELYRKYQLFVHKDSPSQLTRTRYERFLTKSPLKTKLVVIDGDDFKKTLQKSYKVYEKYQKIIHNDPPESIDDFVNFLGSSPMKHYKKDDGPTDGYGSFHQQYWLDNRLIAVGVIDILPSCISSVYFFYDPDFGFLSLGTYGSLKEIAFTRELQRKVPSLKYYYMGFYIHSCPKMRYKGKLNPSYLLCPETYSWELLDEKVTRKLDESKYCRLNEDDSVEDENLLSEDDAGSILILEEREYTTLEDICDDVDESYIKKVIEYGKLIGRVCSQRMLLLKGM